MGSAVVVEIGIGNVLKEAISPDSGHEKIPAIPVKLKPDDIREQDLTGGLCGIPDRHTAC